MVPAPLRQHAGITAASPAGAMAVGRVTPVTRIRSPGMLRKQPPCTVSRSRLVRETHMSCNKQLPGTRSFSVVPSGPAASVSPADRHDSELKKFIPRMVLRLTLEALGRFTCDVTNTKTDNKNTALSW